MRVVVVGGGIAGVLAAAMARERDHQTTLLESEAHLGGLLASTDFAGRRVDFGTHVPQQSGHPQVDSLLFGGMDQAPWRLLAHQRAGNVFGGVLDRRSSFPDVRVLGSTRRAEILADLIDAALRRSVSDESPRSAADALTTTFGSAAVTHVFRPVLQHLFGVSLEELSPDATGFFLKRVVVADDVASSALKSIEQLDARLGFPSFAVQPSERKAWYPKHGGAGRWIDDLERDVLSGVEIVLGSQITHMSGAGVIDRIALSNGFVLNPDVVIWTVPLVHLLRALGRPLPAGLARPRFLSTTLHHVLLDRPALTDLHYVTNYDATIPWFRMTFYDALTRTQPKGGSVVTVEVFGDATRPEPSLEDVLRSAIDVDLLDHRSSVLAHEVREVGAGFPVPVLGWRDGARSMTDAITDVDNVCIVGRASGRAFFMADVLAQTWELVDDALSLS